ncbi:hypothetical protein B4064_3816 [Caldibacillus thermoamylovorans]|jgi:HKD family nuclease|nr:MULTISPECIES: hypothetical protein [Bacillaceae]KIO56716.1 hypothetical protein B4064_3816 [Caldibacillus thermoamylovorans]KIO58403.1 hypothetical protein B4065_3761 [Caldibacillus thermoamylovorans]MEC5273773.1 hypothetical protein [Caldifermentibacillus hisashii]
MKRGILVYNHNELEWRVWIGQQADWIVQGYHFEKHSWKKMWIGSLL